ncbi:MAG: glycosyltransferase family 4 protein [Pseudomonadota bacterium]
MISILYIEKVSHFLGGGQVSLISLIKNLDKKKYKPVVICSGKGEFSRELYKLGSSVYYLNIKSFKGIGLLLIPYYMIRLLLIIKKEKIDIIHNSVPRLVFISGLLSKLLDLHLIWHVRVGWADRIFDRINFYFSSKIICNSKYTSQKFINFKQSNSKVEVVPNGVNVADFACDLVKNNLKKNLGIYGNEIIISMVSQISRQKRQIDFIKAAKIILSKYRNIKFLIVGSEIQKNCRKELDNEVSRLNIMDNVKFIDFYNPISDVFNISDICVLTSENEAFGRVLIEAMAAKKPVVGVNSGGIPEIVENNINGLLVPLKDPENLARAIIQMIKDEAGRIKMGLAGYKKVQGEYTIQKHTQKISDIYLSLVNF